MENKDKPFINYGSPDWKDGHRSGVALGEQRGFELGLRAKLMMAPDHIIIEEIIKRGIAVAAIPLNQIKAEEEKS